MSGQLERLRAALHSSAPLIGGRRRTRALAALLELDTAAATAILVETWRRDPQLLGPEEAELLVAGAPRRVIEAICRLWDDTRHPAVARALQQGQWVATPADLGRMVRTYLLVGRGEELLLGDPDVLEPLLELVDDPELGGPARHTLGAITHPRWVALLHQRWLETRSDTLRAVLQQVGLVADQPMLLRVVSALLLEQDHLLQGRQAIPCLALCCRDPDPAIADGAGRSLQRLAQTEHRPAVIAAIAGQWSQHRHPVLEGLLVGDGLVVERASKPADILAVCKAGRPERVTGDAPVSALVAACADPDPTVREAAAHWFQLLPPPQAQALGAAVAEQWHKSRLPLLATLVEREELVAADPVDARVASALKAGRPDRLVPLQPAMVRPLLREALGDDAQLAEGALALLRELEAPRLVDELTQAVLADDPPGCAGPAAQVAALPEAPLDRALLLFLTRRWPAYDREDFDRRLLHSALTGGDEVLRKRLLEALRQSGRTDLLPPLSVDSWDEGVSIGSLPLAGLVELLIRRQAWDRLWELLFHLPLQPSMRVARVLAHHRFQPQRPDDRAALARLAQLAGSDGAAGLGPLPGAVVRSRLELPRGLRDLAFAPDAPLLGVVDGEGTLVLWNYLDEGVAGRIEGHFIGGAIFCGEGRLVLTTRGNGGTDRVGMWKGGRLLPLGAHAGGVGLLLADGDWLVTIGKQDRTARVWSLREGRKVAQQTLRYQPRAAVLQGERLYLLQWQVEVRTLPHLERVADTGGGTWRGEAHCAAPVGQGQLIVGTGTGRVVVCQAVGEVLRPGERPLVCHAACVALVGIRKGLPILVTVDVAGGIRLTHLGTGQLLKEAAVGAPVSSVALSPGGAFLAVGTAENTLHCYDLRILELPRLGFRPLSEATPADLAVAGTALRDPSISQQGQAALAYVEQILQHRFRFDIRIAQLARERP